MSKQQSIPTTTNILRLEALNPGIYESTVVAVETPQRFWEGDAVRVTYELIDSAGQDFLYNETFCLRCENEHTDKFCEYLEKHDIASWNEFVGCREQIELDYKFYEFDVPSTVKDCRSLDIVKRKFLHKVMGGKLACIRDEVMFEWTRYMPWLTDEEGEPGVFGA